MKTIEITTRLAGTDDQYHVLKVYVDSVFDGSRVHTSKDRNYLERKGADYVKFASTKKFF